MPGVSWAASLSLPAVGSRSGFDVWYSLWVLCDLFVGYWLHFLLASFFPTLFIWTRWNLMWWWSNSSWASWDSFLERFCEAREMTAVSQTVSKHFNVGMHSDVPELIWFKLGLMIVTIVLYSLILVLLTLTLIQGHMSARKQKLLHQVSRKVFNLLLNGICCTVETSWGDERHTRFVSSIKYSREKSMFASFCFWKKVNNGLYSGIYGPISLKLGMMIETTKLYILISVWKTWTFIHGHSCRWNQKLSYPFSHKFEYWFGWNLVCCHNLLVCWSSCHIRFAQILFKENSTDILENVHLASSCVRTLVKRFVSNLVWC